MGGYGGDLLNSGPGFDRINAQDGQRDTIVVCGNENDEIYYDRRIDALRYCEVATNGTRVAASETTTSGKTGKANLTTQAPPRGIFENTGKVLVEHKGEERCVPEKGLKEHLDHGDALINPSGCAGA